MYFNPKKLLLWVGVLLFAAGVWIFAPKLMENFGTTYEDTNGADNYSLQTLTDDDILHNISASVSGGTSKERKGWTTNTVDTVNGVYNVEEYSAMTFQSVFTITLDYTIDHGNGKLVLCSDEEILCTFTPDGTELSYTFDCSEGPVYLRLAGEDCGFTAHYRVTAE